MALGASRTLEDAQADQDRVRSEIQKLQKIAEDKQMALNKHQQKLNELKDKKNALHSDILGVSNTLLHLRFVLKMTL
jgi:peptidoglycan hydrolase CwlO-like protein